MVAEWAIIALQQRNKVSPLALLRWSFTIENYPFFESIDRTSSEGKI